MQIKCFLLIKSILLIVGIWGLCQCAPTGDDIAWKDDIYNELRALGARNWIIIADPSFSAMSGPGAKVVLTDKTSSEVLPCVLDTLETLGHAEPRIYIPLELSYLEESLAPGIKTYNKEIKKLTTGRNTQEIHNETLRRLMLEAAKNYQVLVIKTTTSLPYSSLYIELDSGYWNDESQRLLEERIQQANASQNPQPVALPQENTSIPVSPIYNQEEAPIPLPKSITLPSPASPSNSNSPLKIPVSLPEGEDFYPV